MRSVLTTAKRLDRNGNMEKGKIGRWLVWGEVKKRIRKVESLGERFR